MYITRESLVLFQLCCVCLIFCLWSPVTFSKERNIKYYVINYKVKKKDNLSKIVKKFSVSRSVVNSYNHLILRIKSKNPDVRNWNKLKRGRNLKIYFAIEVLNKNHVKNIKFKKNNKFSFFKKLRSSFFYMASTGIFNQISTENNLNISFSQVSNWSVGLTGVYALKKPWLISSSVYYSALRTTASGLGSDVEIPAEIGMNLYIQSQLRFLKLSYYGGVDYESFSTFNTGLLSTSTNIVINNNSVLYLTFGFAKILDINSFKIFSKLSFSKSVFTKTTIGEGGVVQLKDYDGYKAMLYLNHKILPRWFVHTLYKYHSMQGDDDLSTSRIAAGFGYIIN